MSKKTILITGAAGFVGHHMVEHILKNTDWKVIGIDSLTYAGTWDRLRDCEIELSEFSKCSAYDHPRFTPMHWDFRNKAEPNFIEELKEVTHILHMGAESHVDNSITDPSKFVDANIKGTENMLELARQLPNLSLFVYFSTDEVFGPAPFDTTIDYNDSQLNKKYKDDPHWKLMTADHYKKPSNPDRKATWRFMGYKEEDVHMPKNPYAATKSAAEKLVIAYANTYRLPCMITRQMNIFGERQHPEKFIPMCIRKAIDGGTITIHASPDLQQAGMRHYIHARNVADAHLHLLSEQPWFDGESENREFPYSDIPMYHIVGELEVDNETLARTINELTGILGEQMDIVTEGITEFKLVDFHSSRPGHDLRYAMDGRKLKEHGWEPPKTFQDSMRKMIEWYLDGNMNWLRMDDV
jgi:dTDP-glucose 4,6-dehydratase